MPRFEAVHRVCIVEQQGRANGDSHALAFQPAPCLSVTLVLSRRSSSCLLGQPAGSILSADSHCVMWWPSSSTKLTKPRHALSFCCQCTSNASRRAWPGGVTQQCRRPVLGCSQGRSSGSGRLVVPRNARGMPFPLLIPPAIGPSSRPALTLHHGESVEMEARHRGSGLTGNYGLRTEGGVREVNAVGIPRHLGGWGQAADDGCLFRQSGEWLTGGNRTRLVGEGGEVIPSLVLGGADGSF